MSLITDAAWTYIKRKAIEPSTYGGALLTVLATWHITASTTLIESLESLCVAVAGVLIAVINERKGPNPINAPLPPDGTAPVVTPSTGTAVVVPHVAGTEIPQPERPGFGPSRP